MQQPWEFPRLLIKSNRGRIFLRVGFCISVKIVGEQCKTDTRR